MTTDLLHHAESRAADWLARMSLPLLRISMGLVFLGFGLLKLVPGLSPAEALLIETVSRATGGFLPANLALASVAALEVTIGVILLTGRWLRLGVVLLVVQMAGILGTLVFVSDRLFVGTPLAPTLEGQYVLKDVILGAAVVILAANVLRRRPPHDRASGDAGTAPQASTRSEQIRRDRPDPFEPHRTGVW
jgi:putative oxidoreductase